MSQDQAAYQKYHRSALLLGENKLINLPETILNKIMPEPMSGCWLWIGMRNHANYGRLRREGKLIRAHRFIYEKFKGKFPNSLLVLHKCDNPCCVNPDHLFLGNHQDNSDDKIMKGRQSNQNGEKNPKARLKSEDILFIIASKLPRTALAKKFKVHQNHIWKIKKGLIWKHVLMDGIIR